MLQIQRPIAFSVDSTLTTTRVKINKGQNTDVKVTVVKQYLLKGSEWNNKDISANIWTGNHLITTTKSRRISQPCHSDVHGTIAVLYRSHCACASLGRITAEDVNNIDDINLNIHRT